ELLLGEDGDAFRIPGAGELGRVDASLDIGDLRGGERDDAHVVPIPECDVEVVEVAAGGAGDQDLPHPPTVSPIRSATAPRSSSAPATSARISSAVGFWPSAQSSCRSDPASRRVNHADPNPSRRNE